MDSDIFENDETERRGAVHAALHPTVKRFLKMVARPDLRSEFPEQYQKNWEDKGEMGVVRIIRCRIADHPCELTFSLFFMGEAVKQTGIVIKYQGEALLNEVRKGDVLRFHATKRIDPVVFLKESYPTSSPGMPTGSVSYALEVDDDAEAEVFRAVEQLTGKSEYELRDIWQELIATNTTRRGTDQVSPIIKTWLKRERDRIDLQYLRFAELLLPRAQEVAYFSAHGHTCIVVARRMHGGRIRRMIDAVEPEWWGGTFYGLNMGKLVRMPHEQKDRLLALKSFTGELEFPVEEIYIDNRHIYAVLFVGQEALVWRTLDQAAPDFTGVMPVVAAAPAEKSESFLSRLKRKAAAAPAVPVEQAEAALPYEAPSVHPYLVARAEKAYMAALRERSAELKEARKEFLQLLYDSNVGRFLNNPEEFKGEIQGAIAKALRKDAAGIQKEAALIEAHVTIFYAERE